MKSEKEYSYKCKKCKSSKGNYLHPCPYKTEINDSYEKCNCCDNCRYNCAQDI